MRMRLDNDGAGTNKFSTLRVPDNLAHTPDQSDDEESARQMSVVIHVGEQSPVSVHINHQPLRPHPIKQATGGGKRRASEEILVKERTQGFHRRLIKRSEKAG